MRIHDVNNFKAGQSSTIIRDLKKSIHKDYLLNVVKTISIPRHYVAEKENNTQVAAWIKSQFVRLGFTVTVQGPYGNLVAHTGNGGPSEKILVGAHYDSVPGTPGADDNASAVAVMLACAKAVAKHAAEAPVVFVAFNREEDDLMGSKLFVEHYLAEKPYDISMAHVLEMVGYCSHLPGSQNLPPGLPVDAPDVGDFLGLLSNRSSNRFLKPVLTHARTYLEDFHVLGLQVFMGMEKFFPHLLRSDHAPFWRARIPAIMWTDTSEFRNANYHRATDTPETLDYDFMKRVAQLLLISVVNNHYV